MAEDHKSFLVRHWKLLLNVVTIVALLAFIYGIHHDLATTFSNLARVRGWVLLLLIPIELLNYHAQAKLYQGVFRIVGNELPYKFLYLASVELNFVNHVFPSGGAAGISYFGLRLKNDEITGGKATLIQVMKLALTFLSFEILIVAGLLFLAIGGKVNSLVILVAGSLTTVLILGNGAFIYIVGSQSRINQFFTTVTKFLNRLIQTVRHKSPETINVDKAREVFDDFHANYQLLQRNLPRLRAPFWWALLMNLTEVLAVYAVFVAFGRFVNVGAVILAYGVANFAGLVSVLPGGVGIYEFLMTGVLAAGGVPAGLSLPVVIMYRVVNTLLQLPPGYVLYQRHLAAGRRPKQVV